MKYFLVVVFSILGISANAFSVTPSDSTSAVSTSQGIVTAKVEEQHAAASGLDMLNAQLEDKKQEKRYVGYNGYGGIGGGIGGGYSGYSGYGSLGGYSGYVGGVDPTLYNSYNRFGLDGYSSGGYYGGLANGGYYGTGLNNPLLYTNPYLYYSRLGAGFPYNRGVGYNGYPTSSYYSGNYGNSIVGGGLGGLSPIPLSGTGYQYGPGISGTVY